jgi:5'-3' exonuclease
VLARYTHLDAVPKSEEGWEVTVRSAPKLAATLRDNLDAALLYRDLATLRTDAEIPQSLEDLEWKGVHRGVFIALCDELSFGGIRGRPTRWQD